MFKIRGQRRRKLHIFSCSGMDKAQNSCMEGLSLKTRNRTGRRPVNPVPKKGVANAGHVDPDLMGPPRFQTAFNIGIPGKSLQHPLMGHCRFPVFIIDAHLLTIHRMTPNRPIHYSLIFFNLSMDNRLIPSHNGMLL